MFLFGPLARTFDMTALPWAWLHGLGEGGVGWGEAAGLGRVGERGLTAPLFDSAQKVTQNFFTNTALSLINFTLADHQLGRTRRSHH